jgi:hypothetical protein
VRAAFARAALAACALAGCARALPPPGGEEDRTPPAIIATEPAPLAVVPDFAGPVVFRFDERISERNTQDVVLVSPATGEVELDRGRSELRVSLAGGWRPGLVYRVILLPGIRDLFNNERSVPVELVFSTGPEIPETALAGLVVDRVTGRPARDVFVRALQRPDSILYITAADSGGFYALQHLPVATYEVRAFVDQNANRMFDRTEPASRPQQVVFQPTQDTITHELAVLPFDTTAPRLTRADARDSLQIAATVDDHLEPEASLEFVQASLLLLPDSTPVPGTPILMTADSFAAYRRALADSAPAADSIPARAVPPVPPGRIGDRAPRDTVPVPYREFIVVPPAPLQPGATYVLRISGLTNISGITGGGGEVEFTTPTPPPLRPDTGAVAPQRRDTVPPGPRPRRPFEP